MGNEIRQIDKQENHIHHNTCKCGRICHITSKYLKTFFEIRQFLIKERKNHMWPILSPLIVYGLGLYVLCKLWFVHKWIGHFWLDIWITVFNHSIYKLLTYLLKCELIDWFLHAKERVSGSFKNNKSGI